MMVLDTQKKETKSLFQAVLILVLLDDGLGLLEGVSYSISYHVLILVLLDDGLGRNSNKKTSSQAGGS